MTSFDFASTDDAARHYFELPQLPPPPGATTQWLCFEFFARDLFAHSPGTHFAVVLLGRFDRDAQGVPVRISGRGITLGDTSRAQLPVAHPSLCRERFGGARGAQIESFWFGGNFLFRDGVIADVSLRDGCSYRVHLHARLDGWVAAWFAGADGRPLAGMAPACVRDPAEHPVEAGCSGVLIACGRGADEHGAWSAHFRDLRHGWF